MLRVLMRWLEKSPRKVLFILSALCFTLLAFGLYLQHVEGLNPCPMCIVQRYALLLIAVIALLASSRASKGLHISSAFLLLITAGAGAFVAARQSWLQWYPPEVVSCGRDLYGMIETFPLQRLVPMIFKGSGDCTKVDWTFLGGSIANWSFFCFCGIALLSLGLIWRQIKRRRF